MAIKQLCSMRPACQIGDGGSRTQAGLTVTSLAVFEIIK